MMLKNEDLTVKLYKGQDAIELQKSARDYLSDVLVDVRSENSVLNDEISLYRNLFSFTRSPTESKNIIEEIHFGVMDALQNKEYYQLSEYFHPKVGVRFTPYYSIDLEEDLLLTKTQFINGIKNGKTYYWGQYDNPDGRFDIELTIDEYLKNFFYQRDYLSSQITGYNQRVNEYISFWIGTELLFYNNAIVVECYAEDKINSSTNWD